VQSLLKGKIPLLVALGLGLSAGVVAFSAIKKREADARRGWNLVSVMVADQDIHEGSTITGEMISSRPVPEQFVTSSVVKPDAVSYVLNQKVLVPIQAGDMLLWTQFETLKSERLSSRIQRRGRAISIDVSRKSSVGGWVRPNDHVDVIGTFRDPSTNENVAVTLLQNVIVLATGKMTGTTNLNLVPENQRDYSNVTLLLIPEEAEIVTLGAELGSLSLSLRNEEDVDPIEERGRATVKTLLSGERTKSNQLRRQQIVQIIRGENEGSGLRAHDSPGF
jgi:pilus assembly protein CpaB